MQYWTYFLQILAASLNEVQFGQSKKPQGGCKLFHGQLVDVKNCFIGRQMHRFQISCHAALSKPLHITNH